VKTKDRLTVAWFIGDLMWHCYIWSGP